MEEGLLVDVVEEDAFICVVSFGVFQVIGCCQENV